MADVLPISSDEHLELVNASAPVYWKGASDLTRRGRVWLTLMEEYGMMEFNADISYSGTWTAINKLPEVVPQGDASTITFEEHDSLLKFSVNLRGYRATDKMTHKQWLQNRGNGSQIVNLYDHKSKQLLKAMRKMVNADFYLDGYAANNTNRYIGLNSFLGAGTVVAGDRVALPNDTYAGKSTALGAYGGSWSNSLSSSQRFNAALSNDWPEGQGSEEHDAISPLLVNDTGNWSTGNQFSENCEEVLRWTSITQANRGAALEDANAPPICLMNAHKYQEFLQYFSLRNHQWIPIPEATDLGFPNVLNFEGTWVTHDYDCPVNEAYMMHPAAMEFFSPQDDLFEVYGPQWSMETMSFLYLISNYANFRWQPKLFAKIASFA